jgi:hypothetical protein
LALARSEGPGFSETRVNEDGGLQGLGEFERQLHYDKAAGAEQPSEAGVILIARLLDLLHMFLGETLTDSLLRVIWPGTTLDDSNSENGRDV